MDTDLFQKLTDKQRLWEWLKTKTYVKTSEILNWGATIGFSNRAGRNARDLAKEGKLKRLDKQTKIRCCGNTREEIYEVIK